MSDAQIVDTYHALFDAYGPQNWWPAQTDFEVMVGAILTQNAAWINVEQAIANLRQQGLLDPGAIIATDESMLAVCLRPSGYFNIKATRLRAFCQWYINAGEFAGLDTLSTGALRTELLSVYGVGPETADDILLYAFRRPVFVIDAYTRRLFSRLGNVDEHATYDQLQVLFHSSLNRDVPMFNEYHALIVRHAKQHCRKKPLCEACVLTNRCGFTS